MRAAQTSAVHLELHDSYGIARETDALRTWRRPAGGTWTLPQTTGGGHGSS
ncbi:hypothetical protein ACEZCY_34730 [Streptacidiphilus sp. N1-12]|uniref:Uncharacterized protein n=2 Tax=Streptacidiphilus alkalitolerans TaxID=3342712 RepID=A0ABV6VL70_9ACTN